MVSNLIARQGQLKGNLTQFWNYVAATENEPKQISMRKSNIEDWWEEFHRVQSEIRVDEDVSEHEEYQLDFEELYLKAMAKAEERLQQLEVKENSSINAQIEKEKINVRETTNAIPLMKLAALNVPVFSNVYDE